MHNVYDERFQSFNTDLTDLEAVGPEGQSINSPDVNSGYVNSELDLETQERSVNYYQEFRAKDNRALNVGIFGEDLYSALNDKDTLGYFKTLEDGQYVALPILVPTNKLTWFNNELLRQIYGSDRQIFAYVHPPMEDDNDKAKVTEIIDGVINSGSVVVMEKYVDDYTSVLVDYFKADSSNSDLKIETFGSDEPSRVDFFVGEVDFGSVHPESKKSAFTTYREMVNEGELSADTSTGISLIDVMSEEEADKVWAIYNNPFENLGSKDPTAAGFTKEMLADILKNPEITKVVNKIDGELTTLLILVSDLDKVPWFNSRYYQEKFPDFYNTGNIFISPGIVSDENKRGNNYAVEMLSFLAKVFARRGSNLLLTFECTQISTRYIPAIVKMGIEKNEGVKVNGLENVEGSILYRGISKE